MQREANKASRCSFTKPRASLLYTNTITRNQDVQDDARRVSREHRDVVTSSGRCAAHYNYNQFHLKK